MYTLEASHLISILDDIDRHSTSRTISNHSTFSYSFLCIGSASHSSKRFVADALQTRLKNRLLDIRVLIVDDSEINRKILVRICFYMQPLTCSLAANATI